MVERYLAKKTTAIIAISKKQKNELVAIHKITNKEKVEVVNLGFDLNRFQKNKDEKRNAFVKEYDIDTSAIAIGIIGRLTAVKNHHLFLDVIEDVFRKTNKKVHVFIVGDGELKSDLVNRSEQIIAEFPDQKITFTSWIKDVSIPLARLDMVCLTSFNEGTPVSLIEAQAANVAVLSTNVGGVEDILDDGNTGFIVDVLDTNKYVECILKLIDNSSELDRMKAAGWEFVREKFHYKTLCFNIEHLYLKLLNQSNVQSKIK
jgi:glycosyltransferase involved in cell wall biosynthesis